MSVLSKIEQDYLEAKRAEQDELRAKVDAAQAEINEVNNEIKAIQPDVERLQDKRKSLGEKKREIAERHGLSGPDGLKSQLADVSRDVTKLLQKQRR